MLDLDLILKIFFLLSPLSSIPLLFLAYQQKMNVRRIAVHSAILALLISFGFVVFGPLLFQVFGISLDSFRVAGGVLVFLMGLSIARDTEHNYSKMKADNLINMIATPLLAGPAILSFLIIKTAELGSIPVIANLLCAFALVASLFLLLAYLIKHINLSYVMFVNRLFGLFLGAMGIELMAAGLKVLFFG